MEKLFQNQQTALIFAIALSIMAIIGFLFQTGIIAIPLVLILMSMFIIYPYRHGSSFVRRLLLLYLLLFVGWLLSDLKFALFPFIVSFGVAYLFEPLLSFLSRKKFPRWLAALFIILFLVAVVSAVAFFVFPIIFYQLEDALKKISSMIETATKYLDSRKFYRSLAKLGLPEDKVKEIIQLELIPKLESIFTLLLSSLMSLLTSLSGIATQIINAILIPILSFYLLKDFEKLKKTVSEILEVRSKKALNDLRRINRILRKYISWQILAATIVATFSTLSFSYFDFPYPVVLGVLCGLFNPIPYLGSIASIIICSLIVLIVNPEDIWTSILIIVLTINILHFINAYLLEPNIAGRQVGLHPVLLMASLFVFGGMFGFIGLLIAVPCTATLMMFFNDWRERLFQKDEITKGITKME